MINIDQFHILNYVYKAGSNIKLTQRELSESLGMSLGKVNKILGELRDAKILDQDLKITEIGFETMKPFEVKNAIIMAAGMSSRFVPLSYEQPKALLKVKGEILIEREIEQLQSAGIKNITLVVGYLKEKLFYLEEKYHINIVINEEYFKYNNTSSLIKVVDQLDNTYICSSDNYFTINPFERYVYRSYYAAVFEPGKTDEYCLSCDKKGRIKEVTVGGEASWFMIGHVYFDKKFSNAFAEILKEEYENPMTKQQLWENLYMRYIDKLDLYIKKYDWDQIKEFDNLEELREFDSSYIKNANSTIFKNISKILKIKEENITNIVPIKEGLTNSSFKFQCNGKKYVYRQPGIGTEKYINRKSEAASMKVAQEINLDNTYIYMDPNTGFKISKYIEDAEILDYHNEAQVKEALRMLKKLHSCDVNTGYEFDVWKQISEFEKELSKCGRNDFEDMEEIRANIYSLRKHLDDDKVKKCLCHCDSYSPNYLIDKQGNMSLIDWEYSGMADAACDLGTFIVCADYGEEEVDKVINMYLSHEAEEKEYRHILGYLAVEAFYWFLWALYQDSVGKNVGEYLYIWYRYTKIYTKKALQLYKA